ncbi:hypothetical protein RUND412_010452 [Rhizina undulata]
MNHHDGNSQLPCSKDSGKTFHVINSYIGGCPHTNKVMLFTVLRSPHWRFYLRRKWFNRIGQRGIYIGCSGVTITNDGGGLEPQFSEVYVVNLLQYPTKYPRRRRHGVPSAREIY